jgi:phosphonatase-like hydrolase
MSTIELVVFDMAGTTINDDDAVSRCLRSTLEPLGVSPTRDEVNLVMGIPKPLAIRQLLERYGREELIAQIDAIHDDFVRRMIAFYQTDPSVHEIAGAAETFRRLRAAGIKTALDTGFSRNIVDVVLQRLGWKDDSLLNITVTSDEVPRGRPHPDMIEKIMRELGVGDPRRVAKVGDTPSDLEEGTAARCGMIVGVTGGSHTAEQLRPFPHTHLIGTVAELPALLGIA